MIITGETRTEALERARRALDEMVVEGMATALPFHRRSSATPAFTDEPFTVHTRWIETEFDNAVPAVQPPPADAAEDRPSARPSWSRSAASGWRSRFPAGLARRSAGRPRPPPASRAAGPAAQGRRRGASGDALTSPMQGTIVKIAVADGDTVAEGDLVVVLEAMKMEQPLQRAQGRHGQRAHRRGRRGHHRRRGDLHDLLTATRSGNSYAHLTTSRTWQLRAKVVDWEPHRQ